MALLQVRNFPDETYEVLSKMAKAERRPISQQVILLIERGLAVCDSAKERKMRALERTIARAVPEGMNGVDFAALIREDRNR
jgi:hypothetical protein